MDGTYFTPFLTEGGVPGSYPAAVCQISPSTQGDVFVLKNAGQLARFHSDGVLVTGNFITDSSMISNAYDMAIGKDGNFYIESNNNRNIVKVDSTTGVPDLTFTARPPDDPNFNPAGMAVGPDGDIYILPMDNPSSAFYRLDVSGTGTWTKVGDMPQANPYARLCAIDPDTGALYASGVYFPNGIVKYDKQPDGSYLQDTAYSLDDGHISNPNDSFVVRAYFGQDQNGDGKKDLYVLHETMAPNYDTPAHIQICDVVTATTITVWEGAPGTGRDHSFGFVEGSIAAFGNLTVNATLNDYAGNFGLTNVKVDVSHAGTLVATQTVAASANPTVVNFANLKVQTYDVQVSACKWLPELQSVTLVQDNTTTLNLDLDNGDANGDGSVGLLDLAVLKKGWGKHN